MFTFKKMIALATLFAMIGLSKPSLTALTYVTDTGGYAYDESRAATNLAPAIALGTIAIVGIIAIAVQNSHGRSSSSHSGCECCSSSSGDPSSYSPSYYYSYSTSSYWCHY